MPLYNVTFIDRSDETKKALMKLSKSALRESGKVIRKKLRENVPLRSKRFKNHIASWVMIDRKTGQPTLQIGFYSWQKVRKRGKQPSHASPWWVEFGTMPHEIPTKKIGSFMRYEDIIIGYHAHHPGSKGTHVLRDTVQNNIGEIRAAQEEYLAKITEIIDRDLYGIEKDEFGGGLYEPIEEDEFH